LTVFINQPYGWVFLVLLAAAVVSVAWFYRRVPPTVGRGLRLLLAALRSAALVLLFLALIEPVIALTRVIAQRPVIAVLVDGSRSMAIGDGTGGARRGDEALTLANELVLPRIGRDADVRAFVFSPGVEPLETERKRIPGTLPLDGESTDIGEAFDALERELAGENLGAVVLATDGANNRGGSPYEASVELGVPVFVLGVGSAEPRTDIAVREAITNRISYAGEVLPIEVRISSAGYGDSETTVELSEEGVLLESVPVRLSGSGEETEVTFRVIPATPGIHRYSISVPPAHGELTTANNVRIVATNVFKGKIRALVVAPRPSSDFAFVRREFEADQNVEVTAVALKEGAPTSRGRPLPGSREGLFSYDLIVLVEADWATPPIPSDWLADFVRDRGGGLLLVGVPGRASSDDLASIAPVVLVAGSASAREARVALTAVGETDPTTRFVGDRFANAEMWRSLPPVWTATALRWAAKPDARTLVTASPPGGEELPVVVVGRAGAGSTMAVLAEGLWRWKMAGPEEVDAYDRFLANAARWLTARGELERVVVSSDKDVYAAGEPVRISAQVYREDFRLAQDATVTVAIARGEGAAPVASVVLEPDGDFHRGETGPLEPGRYLIAATAERGGEETGTATAEFTVEEFSLEDSEVRRRSSLLTRIAEDTGGAYVTPETADAMPSTVHLDWKERLSSREFEVWNSPWLLLGFVGLLSVEWTLRRRKGLP
jgi:hypothetical protein